MKEDDSDLKIELDRYSKRSLSNLQNSKKLFNVKKVKSLLGLPYENTYFKVI